MSFAAYDESCNGTSGIAADELASKEEIAYIKGIPAELVDPNRRKMLGFEYIFARDNQTIRISYTVQ